MRQDNRVLNRRGARQLTQAETATVGGAVIVHTNVCTAIIPTQTHTGIGADGDGCGTGDFDHS